MAGDSNTQNRTIHWVLVGEALVIIGVLFYVTTSLSEQIAAVQGDVAEIKAVVQSLVSKSHSQSASPAKPVAATPEKK